MSPKKFLGFSFLFVFVIQAFLFYTEKPKQINEIHFPYQAQGLTKRQAAAHLLSRFTYGATPGQIDEVITMGLENWFAKQLDGSFSEDTLQQKLSQFQFLNLSNSQIVNTFPRPVKLLKMAENDGYISKDSVDAVPRNEIRTKLAAYVKEKNIHTQPELIRELVNQKIIRASYANNQLQEILTDFWFNHFNVALTKPQVIPFALAYERDAIRPNVLGKFSQLLLATAKSPAMLTYLDNFSSAGESDALPDAQLRQRIAEARQKRKENNKDSSAVNQNKNTRRNNGINENYAREVMELHTMGVDGGYTQSDVTQAARILTGWSIYPMGEEYGGQIRKMIENTGEEKLIERGFVRDGDFFFVKSRHDIKEKTVLGKNYPANGGYEEGVDLLNRLAHHSATAKFICKKMAVRFVSDNPPQSLVDKMSKTFLEKDGDINQVMITMVNAPEFWSKKVVREKTKSPFELVISSVRALNAKVISPFQLYRQLEKMGQKIYYYQAPTGFPDRAEYWINTGALLNRMNFGIEISSQQIRGTRVDLLKLNNNHEPENAEAALRTYARLLMPERDMEPTIKRLLPLLTDPSLQQKLLKSSNATKSDELMELEDLFSEEYNKPKVEMNILAQVVGIIIGSPEFQRR